VQRSTLYAWLVNGADTGVPELERLARTIYSWRGELLAYLDTERDLVQRRRTVAYFLTLVDVTPAAAVYESAYRRAAASTATLPVPDGDPLVVDGADLEDL
jgi:hypothetical protein